MPLLVGMREWWEKRKGSKYLRTKSARSWVISFPWACQFVDKLIVLIPLDYLPAALTLLPKWVKIWFAQYSTFCWWRHRGNIVVKQPIFKLFHFFDLLPLKWSKSQPKHSGKLAKQGARNRQHRIICSVCIYRDRFLIILHGLLVGCHRNPSLLFTLIHLHFITLIHLYYSTSTLKHILHWWWKTT